jgi:hypothetical protein
VAIDVDVAVAVAIGMAAVTIIAGVTLALVNSVPSRPVLIRIEPVFPVLELLLALFAGPEGFDSRVVVRVVVWVVRVVRALAELDVEPVLVPVVWVNSGLVRIPVAVLLVLVPLFCGIFGRTAVAVHVGGVGGLEVD